METDKEKKVSLIQDYIKVFSTPEGENVIKDLMEQGYLLTPTYAGDDVKSALNEGKRELVLYILHHLSYDVQSLLGLIDESKNQKRGNKGHEEEDFDFFKD